jgi:hypothetical protein
MSPTNNAGAPRSSRPSASASQSRPHAGQPQRGQHAAVAADREQPGGVAAVVVGPQHPRVPPARHQPAGLDHPRVVDPQQHLGPLSRRSRRERAEQARDNQRDDCTGSPHGKRLPGRPAGACAAAQAMVDGGGRSHTITVPATNATYRRVK